MHITTGVFAHGGLKHIAPLICTSVRLTMWPVEPMPFPQKKKKNLYPLDSQFASFHGNDLMHLVFSLMASAFTGL